jgi:hypothetical protein
MTNCHPARAERWAYNTLFINWLLTKTGGLALLLLVLQFPFFLGIKLGLFALFLFAFIFTAFITHIGFSF